MPVKQATAVLSAPGGEADRVQKMMSARPTLNANQRRSRVRQDISGASPDGTFVGKGGNTQQFGKAAMSRMPPPATPPPDANALQTQMRQLQGGAPSDMDLQAAQAGGAPPGMPTPQFADRVGRMARPMGAPMEMEGPGMGGQQIDPAAIDTALAGAQGAGKGFGPGLPPQIMQRLQALRGIQGGGRGPMAGGGMRSFQDFWQGAGGAGQGNVVY